MEKERLLTWAWNFVSENRPNDVHKKLLLIELRSLVRTQMGYNHTLCLEKAVRHQESGERTMSDFYHRFSNSCTLHHQSLSFWKSRVSVTWELCFLHLSKKHAKISVWWQQGWVEFLFKLDCGWKLKSKYDGISLHNICYRTHFKNKKLRKSTFSQQS